MQVKTKAGRTLKFKPPASNGGWTTGKLEGVAVHVYVRPDEHGGGVFIQHQDGRLHHAETGEETVWFNNRLWTLTEEQEVMERMRHGDE